MYLDVLFLPLYLFTVALTLSVLEIQIEGPNGWAGKLPTWRPSTSLWYARLYFKLLSGKQLTGYHIIFFTLIILIFHVQYAFRVPFTLENELKTLSLFFLFVNVEDFLWFVLNPAFGIHKFFSNQVPWHEKRILLFPPEYYITIGISFLCIIPILLKDASIVFWWLTNLLTFLISILLVILFMILRYGKKGV